MTQIGKMLFDEGRLEGRQEGRQEGDLARAKKTAVKMFARGDSAKEIAEFLELPVSMVEAWQEEAICNV